MSYSVYYAFEDKEAQDGPFVASGTGWLDWGEWVLDIEGCEECHTLYEAGWAMAEPIRDELERLLDADGHNEDRDDITRAVLKAVNALPPGCETIIISDGTEPGDDDDDSGEDE
ncbi:hypothetical protein GobsT_30930 [Gemmata obscuriglobus]|uniref:Uncharacterized protein n=1 Tax=Gemmata obscuriglobus TaxID=114 RepID=A0A2Z3H569_9BACT|nr:hypothetical protein [Gemmata obscuriglobus]AWM38716.1 hypothetical protein C1280_18115 [Gemmata obscuriglobus]QEG28316.1 hypothetical protein GobsT_30930 [Gemmata obscuriglobus]VTS06169.1 unnamed protein product [Gemmata obscuriglobus UQM 2246]